MTKIPSGCSAGILPAVPRAAGPRGPNGRVLSSSWRLVSRSGKRRSKMFLLARFAPSLWHRSGYVKGVRNTRAEMLGGHHGSCDRTSRCSAIRNQGAGPHHYLGSTSGKWRLRRGHDASLLLASLGACAAFYAGEYLRKHNLASEGTRVRVLADKEKNPARLENFRVEVDVPVRLSDAHQKGIENAVHHCLIHNTLLHPPKIAFAIRSLTLA
jgi:hypothetical protein